MVRSASSVYVQYGIEATFGGGATMTKLFGKNQNANGIEWSNNAQALPQLYTPEIQDFLFGRNSGAMTMEYELSNPWIFSWLLGSPTSVLISGALFSHTWDSDPVVNTNIRKIPSGHLEIGFVATDENVVRNAKGVITQSINLKTSIDQPVHVSQSLVWGIEDAISTSIDATVATDGNFTPYNFTHATVEFPSATALVTVQDLDFTININGELLYQLGTPNSAGAWRKIIEITGKVNMGFKSKTELQRVKDRNEVATMQLVFTNGLSGDNEKSITINLADIAVSKHGTSHTPGELVLQDFDFQGQSIDIDARNDTSAQP